VINHKSRYMKAARIERTKFSCFLSREWCSTMNP